MRKKNRDYRPPTRDEIAEYAFYLWNAEGRRSGQDMKYWLEAEAHLTAVRRHDAGLLKPRETLDKVPRSPSPVAAPVGEARSYASHGC